jgi:hypothetical protein
MKARRLSFTESISRKPGLWIQIRIGSGSGFMGKKNEEKNALFLNF